MTHVIYPETTNSNKIGEPELKKIREWVKAGDRRIATVTFFDDETIFWYDGELDYGSRAEVDTLNFIIPDLKKMYNQEQIQNELKQTKMVNEVAL